MCSADSEFEFADEKRSRNRLYVFYCWEIEILGQDRGEK